MAGAHSKTTPFRLYAPLHTVGSSAWRELKNRYPAAYSPYRSPTRSAFQSQRHQGFFDTPRIPCIRRSRETLPEPFPGIEGKREKARSSLIIPKVPSDIMERLIRRLIPVSLVMFPRELSRRRTKSRLTSRRLFPLALLHLERRVQPVQSSHL